VRKLYLTACLCLIAIGCSKGPETQATAPPIEIKGMEPSYTSAGTAFKALADGTSQLVVFGSVPDGSTVLWNDQPMATNGGGKGVFVVGVIPANLFQTAGTAKVTVRSGTTVSNALDFTIYGKTGPAPQVSAMSPTQAVAGKGFSVQPNGDSALGVSGVGFLPGVSMVVDGKAMSTVFGHDNFVSAVIPKALVAKTGVHQVWAENPDKKISNKIEFRITAN
jgi:hypothetical protein